MKIFFSNILFIFTLSSVYASRLEEISSLALQQKAQGSLIKLLQDPESITIEKSIETLRQFWYHPPRKPGQLDLKKELYNTATAFPKNNRLQIDLALSSIVHILYIKDLALQHPHIPVEFPKDTSGDLSIITSSIFSYTLKYFLQTKNIQPPAYWDSSPLTSHIAIFRILAVPYLLENQRNLIASNAPFIPYLGVYKAPLQTEQYSLQTISYPNVHKRYLLQSSGSFVPNNITDHIVANSVYRDMLQYPDLFSDQIVAATVRFWSLGNNDLCTPEIDATLHPITFCAHVIKKIKESLMPSPDKNAPKNGVAMQSINPIYVIPDFMYAYLQIDEMKRNLPQHLHLLKEVDNFCGQQASWLHQKSQEASCAYWYALLMRDTSFTHDQALAFMQKLSCDRPTILHSQISELSIIGSQALKGSIPFSLHCPLKWSSEAKMYFLSTVFRLLQDHPNFSHLPSEFLSSHSDLITSPQILGQLIHTFANSGDKLSFSNGRILVDNVLKALDPLYIPSSPETTTDKEWYQNILKEYSITRSAIMKTIIPLTHACASLHLLKEYCAPQVLQLAAQKLSKHQPNGVKHILYIEAVFLAAESGYPIQNISLDNAATVIETIRNLSNQTFPTLLTYALFQQTLPVLGDGSKTFASRALQAIMRDAYTLIALVDATKSEKLSLFLVVTTKDSQQSSSELVPQNVIHESAEKESGSQEKSLADTEVHDLSKRESSVQQQNGAQSDGEKNAPLFLHEDQAHPTLGNTPSTEGPSFLAPPSSEDTNMEVASPLFLHEDQSHSTLGNSPAIEGSSFLAPPSSEDSNMEVEPPIFLQQNTSYSTLKESEHALTMDAEEKNSETPQSSLTPFTQKESTTLASKHLSGSAKRKSQPAKAKSGPLPNPNKNRSYDRPIFVPEVKGLSCSMETDAQGDTPMTPPFLISSTAPKLTKRKRDPVKSVLIDDPDLDAPSLKKKPVSASPLPEGKKCKAVKKRKGRPYKEHKLKIIFKSTMQTTEEFKAKLAKASRSKI